MTRQSEERAREQWRSAERRRDAAEADSPEETEAALEAEHWQGVYEDRRDETVAEAARHVREESAGLRANADRAVRRATERRSR